MLTTYYHRLPLIVCAGMGKRLSSISVPTVQVVSYGEERKASMKYVHSGCLFSATPGFLKEFMMYINEKDELSILQLYG